MSFDWSHNLQVAQELAEQAKNAPPALQEARYRASISRAYYAVFCKARYHLKRYDKKKEPHPPCNSKGDFVSTHEYVIDTFENSFDDKDHNSIGDTLDTMLKYRRRADYEYNPPMLRLLPIAVKDTLNMAEVALATLNRLQKK